MSGNGIDYQAMYDMVTDILANLREVKIDIRDVKGRMGTVEHGVASLRVDMANVRGDLAGLRGEVAHYHGSVVGHGILITELDERVRRIERHLDLTPAA